MPEGSLCTSSSPRLGRDKTSICYEIHCKAKAVMDGSKIDPSFYPAVFGIEEGDNWKTKVSGAE